MTRRGTKRSSVQDKRKTHSQNDGSITDIYGPRRNRKQSSDETVLRTNKVAIEANTNQPPLREPTSRALARTATTERGTRREAGTRGNDGADGNGETRRAGATRSECRIGRSEPRTANPTTQYNGSAFDNIASGSPQADADEAPLVITIPMNFRPGPGRARKRIVGPDGYDIATAANSCPSIDGTLVKALARAFRWKRLIESGDHSSLAEFAKAEAINPSYLSRILRLTLLAPDIVKAILDGRADSALRLDDLLKPFPVEWKEQAVMFGFGGVLGPLQNSRDLRRQVRTSGRTQ